MSRSIWATLGIRATNDTAEIRRAYARRLKAVHPEDDPAGFQTLRAAYDHALDMARNGWAVPRPPEGAEGDDDDGIDAGGWDDHGARQWTVGSAAFDGGGPTPIDERWGPPGAAAPPPPGAADEPGWSPRAEQARAAEQAAAHQTLCDALSTIVRDPAGDRQEALSALIRVFRSPAMDSLQTHGQTELWLAQLVGFGGPAAEELVEPVIQFFGWNTSRIGVDLSHAQPVLRRRDAADLVRRLEWSGDPDHAAWRTLTRKPAWLRRVMERLTPGLAPRAAALLDRITYDLPVLESRLNPEAVGLWRARLATPILGPIFLWVVLLSGPVVGLIGNQNGAFGPADGQTFLALWTVVTVGLFGLGVAWLYAVARPRQAWVSHDPWGRPLWLRLGWAPAAVAAPLLGGFLPPGAWVAPLLLLTGLGLWAWARVTSAHIARPTGARLDWSRFSGVAPVVAFLLLQAELVGPHGAGLAIGLVAAALALQTGADAVADEQAHQSRHGRVIAAGEMAAVVLGTAAVLAAAATGVGLPQAAGLVIAIALADRALAWSRVGSLLTARRFVLLFGWIGGFVVAALLPYDNFRTQVFVALALWLLSAAAVTALNGLIDGLGLFAGAGGGKRGRKRRPGDLA